MRLPVKLGMLLVAAVFVASACGKSSPSAGGSPSIRKIQIGSDQANDHGSKDVSNESRAEFELDDFYFDPTVLKGKAGQQLTLEVKNDSDAGTLHNFSLSEQSIDMDVPADHPTTITVMFPTSGILEFFCKYHRSRGMAGELSTS